MTRSCGLYPGRPREQCDTPTVTKTRKGTARNWHHGYPARLKAAPDTHHESEVKVQLERPWLWLVRPTLHLWQSCSDEPVSPISARSDATGRQHGAGAVDTGSMPHEREA